MHGNWMRPTRRVAAIGALLFAFVAGPRAAVADAALDAKIDAAAADFRASTGVENFALLMMRGEEVLYRRDFGAYGPATAIPIASATKWITGATVMTLVDEGRLSLDAPVKTYLPELAAPYGDLTLRLLLSYTAGLDSILKLVDIRQDRTITLAQSAEEIAKLPLADPPGTAFRYGGANFQIAGAVVERVTGKRWSDYFFEALGTPLQMSPFRWSIPNPKIPADKVLNPILQGGAVTSADSYGRFLTMIARKGVLEGKRYLSAAAVDEMDKVETRNVEMKLVPPGAGDSNPQYALAHWCEREGPTGCAMLTSPGAYGTYPWIDVENGLHGIILVQDRLERIAAAERRLRDAMIAAAR
ncbi:MAG: beta-lactamase family protein [Alphaproteobacteria bacterium]|nr:beta-lactamase family protein [Alphaproteobacteria bacterium]